ncbi:hypothetical protein CDD83_8258 [Cordyceps sp. RAO-2017]|nr:hypothetical protein CDD83_8258 [Cordyceps sp. RAO-2017]
MQLLAARLARPLASSLSSAAAPSVSRSLTILTPVRPALSPLLQRLSPGGSTSFSPVAAADVVSPSTVSSHPALAGQQLRFGPRNTMNGHTRLIQKRRHGFLFRKRSKTGRRILQRRRNKGRRKLAS